MDNKQLIGIDEYEHLKPLVRGNTAKYLRMIQREAINIMQKDVNNALRRHEDRKAGL